MRQKKTITLLIVSLLFGTISHASNFALSKLNWGNSQPEQESITPPRSGNLPLQEPTGCTSSTSRAVLEEDEDDTAKEKILNTTTFVPSDFCQSYYFTQNVFEALDLEILTPPPQN